jgi:6-phosphogluconolactonase/glucosamine-6-phosphate isomerase/deaminase
MLVRLSPTTRRANEPDFTLRDADDNLVQIEPSRHAITQGIASIMSAGELLLSAHGTSKRNAVRSMLLQPPSAQNPAGFVTQHTNVVVFLDVASFGELPVADLRGRGWELLLEAEAALTVPC